MRIHGRGARVLNAARAPYVRDVRDDVPDVPGVRDVEDVSYVRDVEDVSYVRDVVGAVHVLDGCKGSGHR
ncbi:hypothetical protein [Streptomyces sp. CAI-24]|uniref:hypothetical protein n=1 Tax=Streptomyces sp. CAI-24 TaxID=2712892 RepID=UPI0015860B5B|nr:hypothetical protein [Streptomyces sp. CAI-24]NUV41847.1 hypothetical protein [Streptomyces sp. CAI-24]